MHRDIQGGPYKHRQPVHSARYRHCTITVHVLALLQLSSLAAAHTAFTTLYVDGQNQGDGVCFRMNQDPKTVTFPIESLSSKDIACGWS